MGDSGATVTLTPEMKPLLIKATGRGTRQTVRMDKYGFPCATAKSGKTVNGIQTGDLVKIVQTKGKYIGRYVGRVSAIKTANQYLSIRVNSKPRDFASALATLIQKADGYAYA